MKTIRIRFGAVTLGLSEYMKPQRLLLIVEEYSGVGFSKHRGYESQSLEWEPSCPAKVLHEDQEGKR